MMNQTVNIGGSRIAVQKVGSGPPMVVLHGECGHRGLLALVDRLRSRFEVHVPRLVGWAETARDPTIQTMRDVSLVAQEYIEGLNTPVSLIGASLGGWVAAEISATAPSLLSTLVLISPIGVKIGGREDRDFADLYLLGDKERDALYYASGARPTAASSDGADLFLERAIADDATARFCWQPYMHDPTLKGRLRRIQAATLVLSGGKDKFVTNPDYYKAYSALIPGACHEVIADCGHRPEEEDPQKVADRVTAFVANGRLETRLTA